MHYNGQVNSTNLRKIIKYTQFYLLINLLWLVPFFVRIFKYNRLEFREILAGISISSFIFFLGELLYHWRNKFYFVMFLIILPGSILSTLHALIVDGKPNVMDALTLFDTSFAISKEFIGFNFANVGSNSIWLTPLLLPIISFVQHSRNGYFIFKRAHYWFLLGAFILAVLPLIIRYSRHYQTMNWRNLDPTEGPYLYYYRYLPMQPYVTISDAYKTYKIGNSTQLIPDLSNVSHKPSLLGQDVTVVVIGESLSKLHMGLYGYSRNTTPNLSELSSELLIFNNVQTKHTNTIVSVTQALTIDLNRKPVSLFHILKKINHKTWWISNHPQWGIWESGLSIFVEDADNKIWLNKNHGGILGDDIPSYDEVVFIEFKKAIQNPQKLKVIFLHLLGSHQNYSKRYPDQYKKFTNISITNRSHKHNKLINEYDNSIYYNDYVVSSLIDILKQNKINSTLLYFSDHGDDVFDRDDIYFGHSQAVFSPAMQQIPFFLWFSKGFPKLTEWQKMQRQSFRLDQLNKFWGELIGFNLNT